MVFQEYLVLIVDLGSDDEILYCLGQRSGAKVWRKEYRWAVYSVRGFLSIVYVSPANISI